MSVINLPRNLSIISMINEYSTQPLIPTSTSKQIHQNISEMGSKELLQLQESVQQRILEEKRKELIRMIDMNNNERTTLKLHMKQRQEQVKLLTKLIIDEEAALKACDSRLIVLEAQAIELSEQVQLEEAFIVLGLENKSHDIDNCENNIDESTIPPTPPAIIVQAASDINEDGAATPTRRILPAVGTVLQYQSPVTMRSSSVTRNRRRLHAGQIVPEPLTDSSIKDGSNINQNMNAISLSLNVTTEQQQQNAITSSSTDDIDNQSANNYTEDSTTHNNTIEDSSPLVEHPNYSSNTLDRVNALDVIPSIDMATSISNTPSRTTNRAFFSYYRSNSFLAGGGGSVPSSPSTNPLAIGTSSEHDDINGTPPHIAPRRRGSRLHHRSSSVSMEQVVVTANGDMN
jgi:hypothetical protein